MKNKNTTRPAPGTTDPTTTTTTAAGGDPVAGVPVLRTDTEKALWVALGNNPGFTADELAGAAGIAGSTARRILLGWETAGTARSHRDPDSPRAAKTWTTVGKATAAEPAEPAGTKPVAVEPTAPAAVEEAEPVAVEASEPVIGSVSSQSGATAQPDSGTAPEPADPGPDTGQPDTGQPDTGQPEPAVAAPTGDEPADPAPDTQAPVPDAAAAQPESPERLAPGALRGQVEDFLRDHPDTEFSPHQIGKAITRSSGAVHNALVKLTETDVATQTSAAPKKFRFAAT
ncbi:hypothetical protein ACQPZ2_02155 [Nocardia pseudovaccinii]|uniref:hypothetical protein n=1 Tax=Nocardia pseudovaccinii TaxID=189540 RepID=UPI003D92DDDF